MFDKPIIQTSNPFKPISDVNGITKNMYYGEVTSIDDPTGGGNIKVKILDLDNRTASQDLPWCYPLMPKFLHIYPKVGEVVRIFIEDVKYPQKGRFWIGSVISQQHKIEFESLFTALSTTNMALLGPDVSSSSYPDADGVFPDKEDIALIGRKNTDIVLKPNEVHLRAGKHLNNEIFKLNVSNPATIDMVFETKPEGKTFYSSDVIMADKIALISHDGKPKFKAAKITPEDRTNIFKNSHPIPRGDVLVEALNVMRNAIINHIHGYSGLPADKDAIIASLEKLNFDNMLQKNIVIN